MRPRHVETQYRNLQKPTGTHFFIHWKVGWRNLCTIKTVVFTSKSLNSLSPSLCGTQESTHCFSVHFTLMQPFTTRAMLHNKKNKFLAYKQSNNSRSCQCGRYPKLCHLTVFCSLVNTVHGHIFLLLHSLYEIIVNVFLWKSVLPPSHKASHLQLQ